MAIAAQSNFPKEQLILGIPSADLESEISLIAEKNINIILTKETGNSGFLSTKIKAALQTNTQIIIITQPKVPSYFKQVFTTDALEILLTNNSVVWH